MSKQMSYEDFLEALREHLISMLGEKRALFLLEEYKDDLRYFYDDDFSIAGVAAAILCGY